MGVNYDQAVGLDGFEDIEKFDLSKEEAAGIISIDGIIAHPPNLAVPGGPPGFEPKYGVELMVEKASESAQLLFASGKAVLDAKWGADSEREYDIAMQLAAGYAGKHINWSIMDGDQNEPEWNLGFWIVKPRNIDEVPVLDQQGNFIEDPALFPKRNWAVRCFVEQWAQAKQDRLNIRLLGVQIIQPNARKTGRSMEQTRSLISGLVAKLPAIAAPVQAVLPARAARQAAQMAAERPVRAEGAQGSPRGRTRPTPPAEAPATPRRRAQAAAQTAEEPLEGEILPPEAEAPARRRRAAPAAAEPAPRRRAAATQTVDDGPAQPAPRRRGRATAAPETEAPEASFRDAPAKGRRRVVQAAETADAYEPDDQPYSGDEDETPY